MKKKHYTQLGKKERDQIFLLKKKHFTNSAIADALGRSKTTIGRELRRNVHHKFRQYLPDTAQRKSDKRKALSRKTRYVAKDANLKERIIALLQKRWSPDLIAGRLKRKREPYLNQESIYQFIYNLEGRKLNLRKYLRRAHRIRRQKAGRKTHDRIGIPNRVDMKFYFAKPHSSWQRGANENRNGLVRFYLPRDTDLDKASKGQIRRAENLINNRPMKCLDYQTPSEAFTLELNKLKGQGRMKR